MSHERVANDYKRILHARYQLTKDINEANIVILHIEPHNYDLLFQRYPSLSSKYVISYCVWEASHLPASYAKSLKRVNEVWTCSEYCARAIRLCHRKVSLIPHVVARERTYGSSDARALRRVLSYDPSSFYFLSVTRNFGTRKNISGLIRSFVNAYSGMRNARLVIKTLPGDPPLEVQHEAIIEVPFELSHAQLNALFACSQAVVSAHHAEAWGLSLSDGFLFQLPVIAPAYSGNLEFMNRDNSFLVRSEEHSIPPEDVFGLFTPDMHWASPAEDELSDTLKQVYRDRFSARTGSKLEQAKQDANAFSENAVADLVYQRLNEVLLEI